jgi:hypothetical protein
MNTSKNILTSTKTSRNILPAPKVKKILPRMTVIC